MFHVLNLTTFQWHNWRMNDIPEVEDFAHYFDQASSRLWVFGGYQNGQKSNIFFQVHVQKGATMINENDADALNQPC